MCICNTWSIQFITLYYKWHNIFVWYIVFWLIFLRMLCHRIRYTEGRLLGFSYDFGVTRNSSSNADAMVLGSACLRGIHPLILFRMANVQGGMPLKHALARTMASAFWWWIMAWQRLLELTFCVPYSVATCPSLTFHPWIFLHNPPPCIIRKSMMVTYESIKLY
jgi:hypothetical protein